MSPEKIQEHLKFLNEHEADMDAWEEADAFLNNHRAEIEQIERDNAYAESVKQDYDAALQEVRNE